MEDILAMLAGGDRRSIGRSEEAAALILADPGRFGELFAGLDSPDPRVAMRAADALEKVTHQQPGLLQPYKAELLERAAGARQQEVRWHLAQMLPRLPMDERERAAAFEILAGYLVDRSRIVKTFAMQALADLAVNDDRLRPQVVHIIQEMTRAGSPAMQSRGKKLLARLGG